MSNNLPPKSVSLGQFGPFELSVKPRKDRLVAKAEDITLSCPIGDAMHHVQTYPALAEAFARFMQLGVHLLTCDGDHGEGEPEKDTEEEKSPAEMLDELPVPLRNVIADLAKHLGVNLEDVRIIEVTDQAKDEKE